MSKADTSFEEKNTLSKAVAAKYDPVIVPCYVEVPVKKDGKVVRKDGKVVKIKADLRKCSVKIADQLVEAGFKGIKAKKSATPSVKK